MKTIKVSEATNTQLDWLVAKTVALKENQLSALRIEHGRPVLLWDGGEPRGPRRPCKYTTDWSLMGPILDRCKSVLLKQWLEARPEFKCEVHIYSEENHIAFGPTLCVAAARCYVASTLGETVEVPEEL
jgi:hypothetical protein